MENFIKKYEFTGPIQAVKEIGRPLIGRSNEDIATTSDSADLQSRFMAQRSAVILPFKYCEMKFIWLESVKCKLYVRR